MTAPTKIPFVKACACGNDFLLVDAHSLRSTGESSQTELAEITRRMCDRHQGVGADGIEWLYPHPSADLEIRLINADGSEAEISGNGTRCVAAYVCAEQRKENISIQTGAGLKTCTLISRNAAEYEFEAELGEAIIEPELALAIQSKETRGIPAVVGNPHYVIFVNDFAPNWQQHAIAVQQHPRFNTDGVNVELAIVDGPHDVRARYYERGAGETQSSGTGSCAVAIASMEAGKTESPVRVHTPGGIQTVRRDGKIIFLRGTARLVCRGEYYFS